MSIEKCRSKLMLFFQLAAFVVISGLCLPVFFVGQVKSDEVLEYFKDRASVTYGARHPLLSGVDFSFVATTLYQPLGNKGDVASTDSSSVRLYFSFGDLDSSCTLFGDGPPPDSSLLWVANIFDHNYRFDFFPNDTGGAFIAIGFDRDSAFTTEPVGLAQVDRERYFLHRLFLYYPNRVKHERHSRQIDFRLIDRYQFPSLIIETGAIARVFTTEYFRRTIIITDIKINY